jgi:hypothetical protein
MHLLSFLVGKKTENLNAFLAMISKMIGTANEPEFELKKNEFVILKLNQFSSFGQILSADFNLYTIILAETKHILTTSQIKNSEIFYFRNSKGIIKVKGTILEKSNRSVKFLRLTK